MLSPLSKNSLHPHYDTNIDGMYNFWCVSEYIGNENKIHKAARDSAGLLVAGDLIYTTTAKHITWHLDEQKLVTSERDGDYFQPSIIDLKAKKPRKKIVLTDDEFDQLRSNVYDVCIIDGFVGYKTHYTKPEWRVAENSIAKTDKERFAQKLFELIGIHNLEDIGHSDF